jgi:hypothetical protein
MVGVLTVHVAATWFMTGVIWFVQLVASNWIRTIAWSARALILSAAASRSHAPRNAIVERAASPASTEAPGRQI